MDAKRKEEEKKFSIRWKNRRKRIIGNLCMVLGGICLLGAVAGIVYNYANLSFIGIDTPGSNVNRYKYENFGEMHISFNSIYTQKTYQYLVYFYADDCPHCHEIETTVCKYAVNGPVAVYFVEATQYENPLEIMPEYAIASSLDEAKNCTGTTNISDFRFYGFPSLYFFKDETGETSATTSNVKTLEGVYIGGDEITAILETNS